MTRPPIQSRGDDIADYMVRTPEEYAAEQQHMAEVAAEHYRQSKERQAIGRQKARETYRRTRAAKLAQHPFQKLSDGMAGLVAGWFR
jgi:hypothetical protein